MPILSKEADMRRREFLGVLGGASVAWPLAGRAQEAERVRRIGVLIAAAADDPEFQTFVGAFLQGLGQLGWTIGRNVRIDTRWATANADDIRRHAAELVVLAPDVILSHGTSTVAPLLQATRSVPIVFTALSDPVAAGFVDSLARPGGNATGFMKCRIQHGREISGTAPPSRPWRVEVNPINMGHAGELEPAIVAFASLPRPPSRSDRHSTRARMSRRRARPRARRGR